MKNEIKGELTYKIYQGLLKNFGEKILVVKRLIRKGYPGHPIILKILILT